MKYILTLGLEALFIYLLVCVCTCMPHCTFGGQRGAFTEPILCLHIYEGLGVELRSPGLLSLYLLSQVTGPKLEAIKPGGRQRVYFLVPWTF